MRNPTRVVYAGPSALTLAEAALIEDAVLAILGIGAAGLVVWLLWDQLTKNAGTQQQAMTQLLGYTPSPDSGYATTIPNPSQMSESNPLAPWLPPGPTA
jgi:hypothetical protein